MTVKELMNDFTFAELTEDESRSTHKNKAIVHQATRLMYFDLMDLLPRNLN